MEDSQIIKKAEGIIDKVLKFLGIDAEKKVSMEVEEESNEKYLKIMIEGEDLGHLIGYRGNTLNSLQLILGQILTNEIGVATPTLVDVNGFRKRRSEYLKSLALRAAREAKESGQNVGLLPLNAFERRIVHIALKEEEGISTESEGEGEERHVIVKVDVKSK